LFFFGGGALKSARVCWLRSCTSDLFLHIILFTEQTQVAAYAETIKERTDIKRKGERIVKEVMIRYEVCE
jgi:hypothetical protein